MHYVPEDWFIRDKIANEIDEKYFELADLILSKEINYESEIEKVIECVDQLFDINTSEWSGDEFDYVVQNAIIACAIKELINEGKVTEITKGHLLWKDDINKSSK